MELKILLAFQTLRETYGSFLLPYVSLISEFIKSPFCLWLIACLYWVFNKKLGIFTILNFTIGNFTNNLLKLTFCIYRPWLKYPQLVPAGDSLTGATGYSFPSGHTQRAVSTYSTLYLGCKKKHPIIQTILIVLIVLTAFSRLYLGVHTLQDVLVGVVVGLGVLFILNKLAKAVEKNPNLDKTYLLASIIIAILACLYFTFKSYPIDYWPDGRIVSDPIKMKGDGYFSSGFALGCIISWFVERRYIKFENNYKNPLSYVLAILGYVPIYVGFEFLDEWLKNSFGELFAEFFTPFIISLVVFGLFPLLFKHLVKPKKQ